MWANRQIALLLLSSMEEKGDELRENIGVWFTNHMAFSYKWELQDINRGVDVHAFW